MSVNNTSRILVFTVAKVLHGAYFMWNPMLFLNFKQQNCVAEKKRRKKLRSDWTDQPINGHQMDDQEFIYIQENHGKYIMYQINLREVESKISDHYRWPKPI